IRVRGLHPASASASATIATQSRTRLRLWPRHRRMPIPPPKDEDHDRHDNPGQPNPSRHLMSRRDGAIQLVAHQIADRDDERAPYDRAEHVPSEELEERHPARTRHRTRHESRAGDKSRHEHRLAAVGLKEKLQAVVTRAHEGKGGREPNEHALSAGAADEVAATVADDRADDYGDVDDSQVEQRAAGQESGGKHHGFLGHRDAQVADEHGNEDAEIAPRRDQIRDMRGVGYPMHWKSICREIGATLYPRPRPSPACRIECASVRDFWLVRHQNYASSEAAAATPIESAKMRPEQSELRLSPKRCARDSNRLAKQANVEDHLTQRERSRLPEEELPGDACRTTG